MEKDFYGLQKQIWRMIRTQRKEINELVENKHIAKETWMKYLRSLYSKNKEENVTGRNISEIVINNEKQVVPADVQRALRLLKNRKSPGQDSIPNKVLKHDGQRLIQHLTNIINQILNQHTIRDEWRTNTTILMFKKGNKKEPGNYRGINLLL